MLETLVSAVVIVHIGSALVLEKQCKAADSVRIEYSSGFPEVQDYEYTVRGKELEELLGILRVQEYQPDYNGGLREHKRLVFVKGKTSMHFVIIGNRGLLYRHGVLTIHPEFTKKVDDILKREGYVSSAIIAERWCKAAKRISIKYGSIVQDAYDREYVLTAKEREELLRTLRVQEFWPSSWAGTRGRASVCFDEGPAFGIVEDRFLQTKEGLLVVHPDFIKKLDEIRTALR
jgi:hypothetical protein